MSGPSNAEIIETFMGRAARVINSELVDATKARIQRGYNVNIQMDGNRHILVDHGSFNEYLVKGLAVDLRSATVGRQRLRVAGAWNGRFYAGICRDAKGIVFGRVGYIDATGGAAFGGSVADSPT